MSNILYSELNGRLGNQMFIYAFCRSQALRLGTTPCLYSGLLINSKIAYRLGCFNISSEVSISNKWNANLLHRIGLVTNAFLTDRKSSRVRRIVHTLLNPFYQLCGLMICSEKDFMPLDLFLKRRTVFCIGYFQSEAYFFEHRELIRREFTFKPEIIRKCEAYAIGVRGKKNAVCVHIRLGDYLSLPDFHVCSFDYYRRAIALISEKCKDCYFYIFTDNPELVRDAFDITNSEVVPNAFNDQESLYLGTLCRHHIISNSSFSWWMQYLGHTKEQIVIAPSRWMKDNSHEMIYQKHWIKVEVD